MTQRLCRGVAALIQALSSTKRNDAASREQMDLLGGTEMELDCVFFVTQSC